VFHRKLREQTITRKAFGILCDQFAADCEAMLWEWLPVSAKLVGGVAERLRDLPGDVFIRAADALHLTCAAMHGFREVYSNDRHLLAAASHFGLSGLKA
jgi:hypothetical protein